VTREVGAACVKLVTMELIASIANTAAEVRVNFMLLSYTKVLG